MAKSKLPNLIARFTDMSLAAIMIWAMILGIFIGLFFGERVAWMSDIGNAVIMMMQMTIYPFIVVSLIEGIGRLNKENAKALFSKLAAVLVVVLLIGTAVIFATPLMFPTIETASFFSTSVVAPAPEINYLKLYVPSNPFASLADGSVPAIVIFSIAIGVAMISIDKKSSFMELMETTAKGLSTITQTLVKILPIGIFAMSATAAGTITLEEFANLQVFLISYMIVCLFLTFWLLPFVVGLISPIKGPEVVKVCREALVTAFTTGNIFICLPVLMEGCKKLLHDAKLGDDTSDHNVDVLLPVVYSFPNLGKATILLFILFSGWFVGKPVELGNYPMLAISGIMSLFGSVYASIPFLLNEMQLPTDLMQLFVVSGFLTGKFNSMVAAMHLLIVTLVTVLLVQGKIKLKWIKVGVFTAISTGILLALIIGGRVGMGMILPEAEDLGARLAGMRTAERVPSYVYESVPKSFDRKPVDGNALNRIKREGMIRIGYIPKNVPFSFFNGKDELVGLDINLANMMAEALNVQVEFVPIEISNLVPALRYGYIDLAMSGIAMDNLLLTDVAFTEPVMEMNIAIVAKDHRLSSFKSVAKLREQKEALTITYVEHAGMMQKAKERGRDHFTYQQLDDYVDFFEQEGDEYDLLITSAEAGFAWSMLYPEYGVVIPSDLKIKFPIAFAVAPQSESLLLFANNWLDLAASQGVINREYEFWILGRGAMSDKPRWSILTDVLGVE